MHIDIEGQIESVNIHLNIDDAKLICNLFAKLTLSDIQKILGKNKENGEKVNWTAWLTSDICTELTRVFDLVKEVSE